MEKESVTALVGSIQKFSTEDGPGIRTTVFLKGCPLSCKWCHNPELISFKQQVIEMPNSCIKCGYCINQCPKGAIYINEAEKIEIKWELCDSCLKCTEICYAKGLQAVAKEMTIDEVLYQVEQDKDFYDNTGGGLTLSGGEILFHPRFVEELIDVAGRRDIKVCLDTSGYGDGEILEKIAKKENVTDILYDMKCIDNVKHCELTGMENTVIINNLQRIAGIPEILAKIQMRMPLIKGVNDTSEIIKATGDLFKELGIKKVTLLPYHSLGASKKRNIGEQQEIFEPPTEERIEEIKNYFITEVKINSNISGKV